MDYIIKLAFVLLVFIYSWFFQIQNQEWDMLRSMLKDANNMAVHDAAQQSKTQRVHYREIPIEDIFNSFMLALSAEFEGHQRDVTEENIQARSRGVLLMAS